MTSTSFLFLLSAAHGLVNAIAKRQMQSDKRFTDLCLTQCQQVPQLIYGHKNEKLMVAVAKIFDGRKAAGVGDYA